MGTSDPAPGGKVSGCEAALSPPSSAEVKEEWRYTSTISYVCAKQVACVHTISLFLDFLDNTSQSEICCGSVSLSKTEC
jgi:hypothetical protein